ncbi:hypothetical protein ACKKBG_A07185 [Auxenochlorella protothecoides x Auxenochlorella symbiontica]|uniref:Putative tRNA/rRNA methyltransferase YsgA n=1 Tax=Auxenochlorella protothecoides TaxID=3075 RepID=A0A087SEJ8_AUXPR|nr:putative tRNA/rRNA methyltransferase YsgA [Auxenochlorella protothecoides]KFM24152.1 putative tRNA/rRNA methyltransferase YsgA [Auxenochlorella protothecoides]RMZ52314.1 hypothetical protein APUTEX25_005067 [Auxenochlorella protothecoides]|eukprot:RMZ52314.1 hypothetical protein APUTEX25_005067 [Auxenochlorella protothecoides]
MLLVSRTLVLDLAPHVHTSNLFALSPEDVPEGTPHSNLTLVTPPVMRKLTGLQSVGPGTLAAEVLRNVYSHDLASCGPRQLVLDGVQDPGNMGTLLRTALALGWTDVALLPGCCDPGNDKCLRASQGASLRLRLVATEDVELAASWKATGRMAFAAMVPEGTAVGRGGGAGKKGRALPSLDVADGYPGGVALVLGAEGRGLSASLARACLHLSVPMVPGSVQSLNVAVAGAILMAACSGAWPHLGEPQDGR